MIFSSGEYAARGFGAARDHFPLKRHRASCKIHFTESSFTSDAALRCICTIREHTKNVSCFIHFSISHVVERSAITYHLLQPVFCTFYVFVKIMTSIKLELAKEICTVPRPSICCHAHKSQTLCFICVTGWPTTRQTPAAPIAGRCCKSDPF